MVEKTGLTCFQDTTGLKIFDKLDASLKAAISRSRWLAAIISPSYLQSYWCLFEALEAIQGQDLEQHFVPMSSGTPHPISHWTRTLSSRH
jgi:hypothetical protein